MSSSTTLVVGLMLMIGFSASRRGIVGDGGDCAVVASEVLLLV